ncbi:hypothetical protein A9P82_07005 [Arachidicoccus ginsenosidimutans]|uniref:type IX secretion system lipoprotein PorK/GldK n=1 Tax=Arachidicoccus sp. BS20 TaxID=1850526 RepID=UPI0007F16367|nr:SUMF1/EgtB/PvdO family nonheme iron enzyme [Arachidicoccus sp. BS20]ANI89058.1 hypothetical protein A9P82_07005 [Arachidicoccus sp. BS20]
MKKQFGFVLALALFSISFSYAQKTQHLKKVVSSKRGYVLGLPLRVVEIPTGTFIDSNKNGSPGDNHPMLISDFYISTSEVTNAQYKEFTDWVRDSIAAYLLGGKYLNISKAGDTSINWKNASHIDCTSSENREKLTPILLPPAQTLSHHYEVDPSKLVYVMQGFDYQEAAKKENQGKNPNEFRYRYEVKIYPDTLVWMRDFGYSNNEQMALSYFSSPKYTNYPVVGVNWKQANAYCDWLTRQRIHTEQRSKRMAVGGVCRLPTEAEWAYAASLNEDNDKKIKQQTTPDTPFVFVQRDSSKTKKRSRHNARKHSNDEVEDNTLFPQNIAFGERGKYGIVDLADNVSEWTNTSYYEGGDNFENRFNPDIQWGKIDSDSKSKRRKVVRGGSWKDTPQFKTSYNRFYEDMDGAHSYIGFRVVVNLPE